MNFLTFSETNPIEEDIIINVANSDPIKLPRDVFYNKTGKALVISTGAGGTGTVLVNPLDGSSDYTPGGVIPNAIFTPYTLGSDIAYSNLAITNATYHGVNLYVSYYPIGDIIGGYKINQIDTPPSLGDFDISAGNATLSMDKPNSYPVGYKFRVSWYGGDGSNTFSFTDITGIYLNNVLMSTLAITGNGTGHLDLIKVADNYFLSVGYEVFDRGLFSTGYFDKKIDGTMIQYKSETGLSATTSISNYFGSTAGTMYYTDNSITFPIVYAAAPIVLTNCTNPRVSMSNSITTTGFDMRIYSSNSVSGSLSGLWVSTGRWTTSYPRKN